MNGQLVDPSTGDLLTPDDLALRCIAVSKRLEDEAGKLVAAQRRYARVVDAWQAVYDEAYETAVGTIPEREVAARQACRRSRMPDDPIGPSLALLRTELEGEIRSRKDFAHSLRAVLSGFQSASASIRAVYGAVTG